jgi:D-alanyl-D-alanine carboxypeptidase
MRSSPALATVSFRATKSRGLALVLASLAVITTTMTMLAMIAPGPALARQRRSNPAAAAKPAQPDKLAEPYAAALLMEPETGTVMFENNEHKPWPTASLAKMMIAMIVAEKLADGSLKLSDKVAARTRRPRWAARRSISRKARRFRSTT